MNIRIAHRYWLAGLVACAALSLAAGVSIAQDHYGVANTGRPLIEFDENATTGEVLESAREMFVANKFLLAEMLYKSILIREPDHLAAMLELAVVYEKLGKLQYARGLLTRASILDPYDQDIINLNNSVAKKMARVLQSEVDSLLNLGEFELALPRLSVLLATQPENAELRYKKADCHLKLGRPEAALSEIDEALNMTNDERFFDLKTQAQNIIARREIRTLERRAKKLLALDNESGADKALQLIGRILELDPDHAWAKDSFVALTGGRTIVGLTPELSGRVQQAWSKIKSFGPPVVKTAIGAADFTNRHLKIIVSLLIILLVFHSSFTNMLINGFSPRQALAGQLGKFSIHEVLTLINTQNGTGVLKVRSGGVKGDVYFNNGEIYHCKARKLVGREALEEILDNAKDGFFVFGRSPLTYTKTIDTPLSLILMDLPRRSGAPIMTRAPKPRKQPSRMKQLLDNKS